jgi:hypothetical protein
VSHARRHQEENRGPWYLLTGLVIGLALGLLVSWVILPQSYTDTAPEILAQQYKDQYRVRIAEAYQANGNLERARERLQLLNDTNPVQMMIAQAQRLLAVGGAAGEAGALARLANDLQTPQPTAVPVQNTSIPGVGNDQPTASGNEAVQTPTPAPQSSPTPEATFTPRAVLVRPTAGAPFILKEKKQVCETGQSPALIEVDVYDKSGQPVSGVKIDVTWNGGEDVFYTGLFPEVSPGYADFNMAENEVYRVRAGDGSEVADNISVPSCPGANNTTFAGGWLLTFVEP